MATTEMRTGNGRWKSNSTSAQRKMRASTRIDHHLRAIYRESLEGAARRAPASSEPIFSIYEEQYHQYMLASASPDSSRESSFASLRLCVIPFLENTTR